MCRQVKEIISNNENWEILRQAGKIAAGKVIENEIALPVNRKIVDSRKKTKPNFILLLMVCAWACNQPGTQEKSSPRVQTLTHDTIPETRAQVSKKAVASYYAVVGDPKLDRRFGVSVYETPLTFRYVLRMQYEAVQATDTLKLPNFGSWPKVEVQPGKDKLSCIIGFLDKNGAFKEYKMLKAQGNTMKLETLKKYGVGRYSTPY